MMRISYIKKRFYVGAYNRFSTLDKKNFKANRHYDMNIKSSKSKFKIKTADEKDISIEKENNLKQDILVDDKKEDPNEKYKAFSYNFPDEESKRRFENYTEYTKYQKAIQMHHDSIFKIKNFFVRRNFLKRKLKENLDSCNEEKFVEEKEKQEILMKIIDVQKEKILIYETNANIIDILKMGRRFSIFCLIITSLNNYTFITNFRYLYEFTFTSYLFTYYFNICSFGFFLFYKKLNNDFVLQAEYLHKSNELLILKKRPFSQKPKEEKVNVNDLEYFKSNRYYEKNSKYLRNMKTNKKYAFHESGIWHQEKVFDFIFNIKSN